MRPADETPWKYVVMWLRLFFATHLIYSGMAFVIDGWIPSKMAMGSTPSGLFMASLAEIGLYPYVKYLEAIVGFMLLFNFAVPLALVLEFPITVTIFFLNTFVEGEGRHLFTGPQEMILNASLLVAYGGYYINFLRIKAQPWWLWDGKMTSEQGGQS